MKKIFFFSLDDF